MSPHCRGSCGSHIFVGDLQEEKLIPFLSESLLTVSFRYFFLQMTKEFKKIIVLSEALSSFFNRGRVQSTKQQQENQKQKKETRWNKIYKCNRFNPFEPKTKKETRTLNQWFILQNLCTIL